MRLFLSVLSVLVCLPVLRAGGPPTLLMRPVPVSATGPHQIVGNEIILDGADQMVLIDMMVDDWDPAEMGTLVKAFQVWLDESSYTNGVSGAIEPYFPDCTSNADCANAIAPGALCNLGADPFPLNKCGPGFINAGREDYIFRARSDLRAVDQSDLEFRWGAALVDGPIWITRCEGGIFPGEACYTDDDCAGFPDVIPDGTCVISHVPRYLGTMTFFVPVDAVGTFTVRLRESTFSNLIDGNSQFLPITVGEALITVGCASSASCVSPDACHDGDCMDGRCVNVPNYDDALFCCAPADGALCNTAPTPGDEDNDGDRDLLDIAALQRCFGAERSGATCASADLACDCAINIADYDLFANGITGPATP